jgi:hypothetical protein
MYYTLEKIEQRKAEIEILMRLLEVSLELISVFKEASRNFTIIFLFHKAAKKCKNHLRLYRMYCVISYRPSTKYSSGGSV